MYNIVSKAAKFAAKAHIQQVRKYTGEPYINHPGRVAMAVSTHKYATDEMIAAAWLHDTIEDCGVTQEEIFSEFGYEVHKIVCELTNPVKPAGMRRPERKKMDREHLARASLSSKIIKLYDRLDNLRDLVECPDDFPLKYAQESLKLLEVIGHADRKIEQLILKEIESLTQVKSASKSKADWELERHIRSIIGLAE